MGIINKVSDNLYTKTSLANKYPETAVSEKRAYYIAAGGETSVNIADFTGDRINWTSGDHFQLRVIRSTGGEQIPRMVGMGTSGWGVDCSSPPYITFNTPTLQMNETIYIIAPNSFQTLVRPEGTNFHTDDLEVPASTSGVAFNLSRPIPLTYHNSVRRGKHYWVTVDGKEQRLNTDNGSTGGDYYENQLIGTDTFDSITFNTAIYDAVRDLNVTIQSLGFYDGDNISTQQLINNTSSIVDNTARLNSPLPYVESESSGTFTTTSTSEVDITNLSGTITTNGSPIWVGLQGDSIPGNNCFIGISNSSISNPVGYFILKRDGTEIHFSQIYRTGNGGGTYGVRFPSSSVWQIDNPGPGTYVYTARAKSNEGTTTTLAYYSKLILCKFNEVGV